MKLPGYFTENVKHETFNEKKTSNCKSWNSNNMDLQVLPQPCLPGHSAISQQSLLISRRMEKKIKRDLAPHIPQSTVLRMWSKLIEVHIPDRPSRSLQSPRCKDKATTPGWPVYDGQLVVNHRLFNHLSSCLRCAEPSLHLCFSKHLRFF